MFIEHFFGNFSHLIEFESTHSVNTLCVSGLWSFDDLQPSIYVMVADPVRGELADYLFSGLL